MADLDRASALSVLLAEYNRLKSEQDRRIGARDNLTRDAWVAAAAVLGAVVTDIAHPAVLLLIPPVVLVLGWTYLRNDRMVTRIREYMADDLRHQMAADVDAPPEDLLRWEHRRGGAGRRAGRVAARLTQLAADLTTFVAPAVAAVVGYVATAGWSGAGWLTLAAVELAAAAALAVVFAAAVDVSR